MANEIVNDDIEKENLHRDVLRSIDPDTGKDQFGFYVIDATENMIDRNKELPDGFEYRSRIQQGFNIFIAFALFVGVSSLGGYHLYQAIVSAS
jgi:hypothetical protein